MNKPPHIAVEMKVTVERTPEMNAGFLAKLLCLLEKDFGVYAYALTRPAEYVLSINLSRSNIPAGKTLRKTVRAALEHIRRESGMGNFEQE